VGQTPPHEVDQEGRQAAQCSSSSSNSQPQGCSRCSSSKGSYHAAAATSQQGPAAAAAPAQQASQEERGDVPSRQAGCAPRQCTATSCSGCKHEPHHMAQARCCCSCAASAPHPSSGCACACCLGYCAKGRRSSSRSSGQSGVSNPRNSSSSSRWRQGHAAGSCSDGGAAQPAQCTRTQPGTAGRQETGPVHGVLQVGV
jgi:hypothetical protein